MMSKALVKTAAGGAALNRQQWSLTQQQEVAEGKEMEGVGEEGAVPHSWQPHFSASLPTNGTGTHRKNAALAKLELTAACKHMPAALRQLCTAPADQAGSAERPYWLPFIPVIFSVFIISDIIMAKPKFSLHTWMMNWSCPDVIIDNNRAKDIGVFCFIVSKCVCFSHPVYSPTSMDVIHFKMERKPKISHSVDKG